MTANKYIKYKIDELNHQKIIDMNNIIIDYQSIEAALIEFVDACVKRYSVNNKKLLMSIDNENICSKVMTEIMKEIQNTISSTFLNQILLIYNKQKLSEIIFITALLAVRNESQDILQHENESINNEEYDIGNYNEYDE